MVSVKIHILYHLHLTAETIGSILIFPNLECVWVGDSRPMRVNYLFGKGLISLVSLENYCLPDADHIDYGVKKIFVQCQRCPALIWATRAATANHRALSLSLMTPPPLIQMPGCAYINGKHTASFRENC